MLKLYFDENPKPPALDLVVNMIIKIPRVKINFNIVRNGIKILYETVFYFFLIKKTYKPLFTT